MDAKKLIEHLHQMGDDAWRDWEKMCSELCLGFEAKLNSGQFNRNSLSVLENASRLYGRYQAYRDAEAKIVALMDDPPGNTWSCPDCAEEGQESLASASCLGGKTEITVESVRRQWKPGDSFVDDEEGNAHIRAVLNVSAGTIYATDGTRHRVAMCRHVDQPSDFFSGPEWDEKWDRKYVPDDPVAVGLARARSIRKAIDYLLAKEKL